MIIRPYLFLYVVGFEYFFYICNMKRLLVILFSVLLLACGKQQEPVDEQPLPFTFDENLQQIDSLLQHDADSALTMLLTAQHQTDFDKNYQSLLISEALYKTYNPQLNRYKDETFQETSLHEAIDYFDSLYVNYPKNDDLAILSARSHYMNGVGYYENDSVVDACKEYLKTLEIMEDHFDTEKLTGYKAKFMGLTCTRLGEAFYHNDIAQVSLELYKNAFHYLHQAQYSIANTYRRIGGSYYLYHQPDSALFYYRKAMHIAKEQGKMSLYSATLSESAPIYYDLGYVDSAFIVIKESLLLPCSNDASLARYYTLGSIYAKERYFDSAIIYLEKSFYRNSYTTQTASAELLITCYQALGDTTKADFYQKVYGNNFTVYRSNAEITTEMTKLYNGYKQKRLDKNMILKRKHQYCVYFIVLSVVLLIIAGIIAISRIKVRNTINKSKIDIADRDRALADMKRKLGANPFINEPICNFIWKVVAENSFKAKIDFKVYKDHALDKNQIMLLRDAVDRHYNNFTKKLGKKYPELTVDDIDYCCLYLLGLKDADISALIQRAYPTVHQRGNKLKHIFNTKESLQTTIAGKASESQLKL